jgi:hypothetical protein
VWQVIGWILWVVVTYLAISFAVGCRKYAKIGQGFQWATGVQTFFLWSVVILFLIFDDWPKLHIIWVTPVLFFSAQYLSLGQIPILSPLILFLAKLFLNIILIGIKKPADISLFHTIPKWAEHLPEYMRPSPEQIIKLEAIRQKIEASQEAFSFFIAGHPATTRKVQHYHYNELKRRYPEWTHYQILEEMLRSRWSSGVAQGLDLFELSNYSSDEMERKIEQMARQAGTVDALTDLFIKAEAAYEVAPLPGYEWARTEVDHLLGELKATTDDPA